MKRIFFLLLVSGILFSACSGNISSPSVSQPSTETPIPNPTTPAVVESQQCGYQWATQPQPELSRDFQQSIQTLQADAQANAYAFGENCVLSDGTVASFSAMETDFNVMLKVQDLTDEAELGDWIVKAMQVIEKIPEEQIVGPQPGRVSITFQSANDQKIINFYTNQYQELPSGLSGSEIYRALQIPQ